MKIIRLQAENVKKLTVVEVVPDPKGGLVIVSGKNGAGKSSVLDSIMYALGGKEVLAKKPVRRGEDKARVELDIGDYTITRTMTPGGGGSLIVRNRDAQRVESPQTVLDGLLGQLSFDPLEFRTMKPDKRSETLQKLMGFNFAPIDVEITQVFTDRTIVNREVKSLEAQIQAVKEHDGVPKEEVSVSSVLEEQKAAADVNRKNDQVRSDEQKMREKCNAVTRKMISLGERADELTLEIERSQKLLGGVEAELKVEKEAYEGMKKILDARMADVAALKDVDLDQFSNRIKEVQAINSKIQANAQKAKLRSAHKAKSKEAEAMSDKIEKLEKDKRAAIQAAKFPVPGLSLNIETRDVEVDGIAFDEINTAQQLKVSVAMGLAMNPKLKVLLVRQGNDLDSDNLELIAKMAEEADAQVWIERVNPEGRTSVIIEDGHVKEAVSNEEEKMNIREGDPEADHHERTATGELPLQPEDKPLL